MKVSFDMHTYIMHTFISIQKYLHACKYTHMDTMQVQHTAYLWYTHTHLTTVVDSLQLSQCIWWSTSIYVSFSSGGEGQFVLYHLAGGGALDSSNMHLLALVMWVNQGNDAQQNHHFHHKFHVNLQSCRNLHAQEFRIM
jgi:hypothetical protein